MKLRHLVSLRVLTFLVFPLLLSSGCKEGQILTSSTGQNSYDVQRLRRRSKTATAILSGRLLDSRAQLPLAELARVSVNEQVVSANAVGQYRVELPAGTYALIGRNIFYRNVYTKKLHVQAGDSLIVDFYLPPDSTAN